MWKALGAVAATGVGLALARWQLRDWGATPVERVARLAGDDLVPSPAEVATRAVTIEAPAEVVWRWLVQIGQDRGGFYSYDRLENLFGLHICNVRRIHPEWQQLSVGDTVRLTPRHWLGLGDRVALSVVRVDTGRSIVLRQQPDMPWDSVSSFHVTPLAARAVPSHLPRSLRLPGAPGLAGRAVDGPDHPGDDAAHAAGHSGPGRATGDRLTRPVHTRRGRGQRKEAGMPNGGQLTVNMPHAQAMADESGLSDLKPASRRAGERPDRGRAALTR